MVVFALRERGLVHVLRRFMTSDSASVDALARDLRFRSMPPAIENLRSYYVDVEFDVAPDDEHHLVRLPSGERFLIRKARGWHDLGTLHETFVQQIYARHPPLAGKTVIDVGANIGDTAVYFAKRGARVVAFEPDPEMCALARRNAQLNGVVVEFHDAGVGGANETMLLSSSPSGADSMSVTLFPGSAPVNRLHVATRPVRVVALRDALAPFDSIGLVKMDCEGCEYPALRSLAPHLMCKIDHIIMEYHGCSDTLVEMLVAAGFAVRLEGSMYLYADRIDVDEGALTSPPE